MGGLPAAWRGDDHFIEQRAQQLLTCRAPLWWARPTPAAGPCRVRAHLALVGRQFARSAPLAAFEFGPRLFEFCSGAVPIPSRGRGRRGDSRARRRGTGVRRARLHDTPVRRPDATVRERRHDRLRCVRRCATRPPDRPAARGRARLRKPPGRSVRRRCSGSTRLFPWTMFWSGQ